MERPASRRSASHLGMRASVLTAVLASCTWLLSAPTTTAQDSERPNQLHYPLADDLAGILRAADAARAAGRLEEAIDGYRMVLDSDRSGRAGYQVAPADEPVPARGPAAMVAHRRLVGVTEWAMSGLRALPPEGVKLFRARYDYRAGSAMAEARAASEPFHALARVYELFPISSHAPKLLEAMADLAAERGDLARALQTLDRLLAHHGAEVPDPPRLRRKVLMCAVGLGLPARVREVGTQLLRDDPRGRIHLGAAPVSLDELVHRATALDERRKGHAEGHGAALPLVRVDPENRAAVDVRPALGPPRFAPRTFEINSLSHVNRFQPNQVAQSHQPARHLPVIHGDHVFLATADQVVAYDVRTGEEGQRIPRLGPAHADGNPKVQFGGAVEQETLVVPLVDEVLRDQQYRGIPIKVKIPLRKLAGFDVPSWRWAWNHARLLDGTPLERWSFPCPPTAVDGVVFAPAFSIEGFVNSHVAAFDARTGARLWDTWVVSGQVEQTMFGEQATEPLCTPVAVHDGVVYTSTSFGCVAALDAITGRPLWLTEYPQLEVRAARGYYPDHRQIGWENNAPIYEAGVLVAAPLDSSKYLGFDARTGQRLWELPQRASALSGEMKYLLGACTVGGEGVVVVGGGGEVRCLSTRSGKLLWSTPLRGRTVSGRGCIAQGTVLVPVDRNEVVLIDVETGKRTGNAEVGTTGNIVLAGEQALVTGNGTLSVHRVGSAPQGPPPQQRGQDF